MNCPGNEMMRQNRPNIGLIGDYNPEVPAHRAIPVALKLAGEALGVEPAFQWVATETVADSTLLSGFDGFWCVPASPYRSMHGALLAIRYARENGIPFLGTCGGFQHAVVEYARNVLGWADADHAETAPFAKRLVVSPLQCSLVEATQRLKLVPGSRLAAAYGALEAIEEYRCRYGLNPEFQAELLSGPLQVSARDENGDVRAIELSPHPFYVATLFQPERAALKGKLPPLVEAFVHAVLR
jgi:CTP synthase (UTP-ammonia lyase)